MKQPELLFHSVSPMWSKLFFVNYLSVARICILQKGCTRLAAASDQVYQLLAHGWWISLGNPASSTTKTGRHDIAEIFSN
jgi:hypothetical protein